MPSALISIAHGNFVLKSKIIAVVSPESAPIKRLIADAKERQQLVDATYGRRTKSVLIAESNHVILCGLLPATIGDRINSE
jgi:regulator of extracellular matrix RemA (YlzA/DUF370 family)